VTYRPPFDLPDYVRADGSVVGDSVLPTVTEPPAVEAPAPHPPRPNRLRDVKVLRERLGDVWKNASQEQRDAYLRAYREAEGRDG
jgi:hypothetical protein